ncbi:SpltGVORF33-like protein [Hyphantria cunea granulovirus]|uniref:SpltGVORF33-like protein n=1 Tax=Hyphantria cunea granulovirus TaxID=307448 RepID=A0AAF1D264_9BBAC|nr:SpltGVORF33-like protein [Hyphantria cunea granulovirus]QBQ01586.1 SpltGVORF33-like protein [Hyphantria cunea granulovirus]
MTFLLDLVLEEKDVFIELARRMEPRQIKPLIDVINYKLTTLLKTKGDPRLSAYMFSITLDDTVYYYGGDEKQIVALHFALVDGIKSMYRQLSSSTL